VAAALGVSGRTLRAWGHAVARAPVGPRGRPAHPLSAEDTRMIRLALRLHDGPLTATVVQRWCPTASRRSVHAWLRTYRRALRRRLAAVRWACPGRVWALDLSEPPRPIDGCYRYVVHVRDLASHYHLAALPVRRATAQPVCDLLRAICGATRPPLVLKVDNGSPCVSRQLRAWAQHAGTALLYSPPAWPRYNGSIEASIGSLTTRTHELAALDGHPGTWTTDDVERARTHANATMRPAGDVVAPPAVRWRTAARITAAERRRFTTCYARELGAATPRHAIVGRARRRLALVRALGVLGYVTITRRADLVHRFTQRTRQRLRT
jgi:hypothetical protein